MGMKQFLYLVLLLPICLHASTKLPENISDKIISFTLFNYDNLIADSYEKEKPYITELASLLAKATNITETIYCQLLNSNDLSSESSPVKYMLLLNKKTAKISNYYFVDD